MAAFTASAVAVSAALVVDVFAAGLVAAAAAASDPDGVVNP
jgi:hypothetical protein